MAMDDEDDDFIGLSMAMDFNTAEKKKEDADEAKELPTRPEPQAATTPAATNGTGPVMDAPVTQDTQEAAYYKRSDEDSVSTMGMSATQTVGGGEFLASREGTHTLSDRPTLGDMEGAVVGPSSTASTNNTPQGQAGISTVHQPTVVHTPSDAQTTASSVTMESLFSSLERRQEQQMKQQEKMFQQSMRQQEMMMAALMKQMSVPSGSIQASGDEADDAGTPPAEAGQGM